MTAQPVVVPYSSLLSQPESVGEKLEQALGSRDGSLGIVVIDGMSSSSLSAFERRVLVLLSESNSRAPRDICWAEGEALHPRGAASEH